MNETPRPGQRVPDFEMDTYEPARRVPARFSLAEQRRRGRWTVLFFYPKDATSVCASELEALADRHAHFAALGCDVLAVSTDSLDTHRRWHESAPEMARVAFPMGSDAAGALARLFGVLDEGSGLALRGAFIISPDGILLASEVTFYNLGRNVDELLRKVRANHYLARTPGGTCPANWTGEAERAGGDPRPAGGGER